MTDATLPNFCAGLYLFHLRRRGQPVPAFDLEREQRRIARLVRAAWGVGRTQPAFMALGSQKQEEKIMDWVQGALDSRAITLGLIPPQ